MRCRATHLSKEVDAFSPRQPVGSTSGRFIGWEPARELEVPDLPRGRLIRRLLRESGSEVEQR
jgi:hypothetical protein